MSLIDILKIFIKSRDIGQTRFDSEVGFSRGYISNIKTTIGADKLGRISEKYPELNLDWLITGQGDMLKEAQPYSIPEKEELMVMEEVAMPYRRSSVTSVRNIEEQEIPLYDLHAAAGLKMLFEGGHQNVINKLKIPNLMKCDGAIFITGDSMYPLLKSGDIVVFKQIHDLNYLHFGDIYLLSYHINGDDYLVIKYVQKSEKEGHFRLVSYNDHHQPIDIPISAVNAIACVKASVRYNTMQ